MFTEVEINCIDLFTEVGIICIDLFTEVGINCIELFTVSKLVFSTQSTSAVITGRYCSQRLE